ncbi:hypothetical protein [Candidatus Magnetominusculus xianensis]|uniref:Secreted protein n=1 Tax=Candidatus Magnetominusculus xianensis TaxID=1748249 RepID=A0ABR5SFM0_9BACT|nr:hypothetical protein [Candidatus Magnetominusculus xianensis]KWT86725.1 hypothetical protein ASN18_1448 [Candidatus Magnetominusculus xianensis]MBF0402556.1 hypothetical protein [Nitrospirota bacterium]
MNKVVWAAMLILLLSAIFPSWVCAADPSFTQQDRERLTRVEVRVDEGLKATNQRIDDTSKATNQRMDDGFNALNRQMNDGFNALNHRMNDLNTRMSDLYGLMYVLIGGMLTLVGFVLWDRRTTLAPVIRTNRELQERGDKIEKVLKELALKDPNMAETIKHIGL